MTRYTVHAIHNGEYESFVTYIENLARDMYSLWVKNPRMSAQGIMKEYE